jgi:protein-S-isoprenylcysteine O-methyltransferase Ste14
MNSSSPTELCERPALLESVTAFGWLTIGNRKLDLLWTAISFGLAIFTWHYAIREPYAPIWLYTASSFQCGVLFAVRHPARVSTRRPLEILVTLLSLNYFFAFHPVPIAASTFAPCGGIISTIGVLLNLIGVQCLGRNFAVFPSLRTIQTSGLYRFVRHPIYLSYIVIAIGILVRHPITYNAAVALAGVILMIWRIKFEERLLAQDKNYRDYMDVVRYRLIPGIY